MVEPRPEQNFPATPVAQPAPARAPVALATMALVLAAGGLFGILRVLMLSDRLETKIAALEASHTSDDRLHGRLSRSVEVLGNAVTLLSDEQVDMTNSKLQHLRHGLAVSELAIARRDSGVQVEGRLINASSLSYRNATFRVKVGSSSKEFTIGNLPPGSSGEFAIVLPNLPLENARTGTFSLVSSAVEYNR
jgi:hypothetical protein